MSELDDATVEAIARTLHVEGAWCGDCEFAGWDTCADCRRVCMTYARAAAAALPDPRPTRSDAVRDNPYLSKEPHAMARLQSLGCFRPEPADEGAFSWPVTIRPDPEGWEPVDG